ncbi:MAG TPA: hypothetical protein VII71_05610, partial [Verrucomicrobiae bacterium]
GNEKFLVVNCPHCGKETVLTLQKSESPQVVYVQSPPLPQSQKKSHGIFYYVFFGVVSLIVTFFILWIFLVVFLGVGFFAIPAFIAARHDAQIKSGLIINETNSSIALSKEKSDYIIMNLRLYDFAAQYHDSEFNGKVPGVDFKIKNWGQRILNEIEVTVYFKDASSNIISEDKFYPVLVAEFGTDNEPLKPGYIWQQEQGKFYAAKKVPSEWQEGNATAKITDIKFSN